MEQALQLLTDIWGTSTGHFRVFHDSIRAIIMFAVLLLAIESIASARMMAPDENTIIRAEVAALGLSPDDICGDHFGHEHRCPFCHLTCIVAEIRFEA